MHVLLLPSESVMTEWSPLGGIFQMDLAHALAEAGHRVGVVSVGKLPASHLWRRRGYPALESVDGVPVLRRYLRVPVPQGADRGLWLGRLYARAAAPVLATYRAAFGTPEIIHAHNVRYGGAIARTLSRRTGIPYVVTEHSSEYSTGRVTAGQRAAFRAVLEEASGASAVSGRFARTIGDVLAMPAARISVIPNAMPRAFADSPASAQVPSGRFTVLAVGELLPIKNHALLLRAFALAFAGQAAALRIVGGGALAGLLAAQAEALGIGGQVTFLGRRTRDEVLAEMRAAHCLALSSDSETFGVVVVEALSQGLPVVSTACGGPEDIIRPADGRLVPVGDAGALASALLDLRQNAGRFDRAGIIAQCRERFSAPAVAREYVAWYARALSKGSVREGSA
ncbi:MAG: glycosyltransferase [Gemmatimonadetes bacterium]|nr:glycosyltransferase [Gemmatimonadota bacterium]